MSDDTGKDGNLGMESIYFYQLEVRGRKIRALSIAGMNLIRRELGLPSIRPYNWRDLNQEEKRNLIRETRTGATPEMLSRLFGKDFSWNDPITE